MSTRIDPVETYCQTVFKKLLHGLPYAVVFILVSQIIIQKLRNYLFAKLNEFLNSITLFLNCLIESGESISSFESRSEIEAIQFEDCNTTNSGTCISVDNNVDSFNTAIISSQIVDDSMSDVEIFREDSDEENDEKENEKLAENIEVKRSLLQNKRQVLSNRLLASKLMEFQTDDPTLDTKHSLYLPIPPFMRTKSESPIPIMEEIDISPIAATPASPLQNSNSKLMEFQTDNPTLDTKHSLYLPIPPFFRTKSESPIPIMEEIDISPIAATPASPLQNSTSFFPDVNEFYGFTSEDMLALAIQASLDDLVAKQAQDSGLVPPQDESSSAKLQEQQPSTEAGDQVGSAASPSKVNPQHTTPDKMKNRSQQMPPHAVNSLELWRNNNYLQDADSSGTQQEDSENIAEDFMEGDRYVGDKGKRPQSKRYAYKKRAKPSNPEPEEKSSSDSGDVQR
ncbi:hypothetical protein JTE90_017782 [Oedothorax gibbosus]|uniref:Uncharacterized protein n=1 Tax=Oedothorax gibbosus TaxID=931172 RepID=A0AAV6UMH9_9ARAC|nr:hypothetical protein JTE90_017782 [Oedothorax gibbosus]